jgi:hypothetical protein
LSASLIGDKISPEIEEKKAGGSFPYELAFSGHENRIFGMVCQGESVTNLFLGSDIESHLCPK